MPFTFPPVIYESTCIQFKSYISRKSTHPGGRIWERFSFYILEADQTSKDFGWRGGAELIISLARKARKLKPGDSNNTATCKSVVGTSHIAAVYHIAMGQFTANTKYHWEHIIMKWMEMRNITFDKSAMMRVKYFILQWAGDVLLCIVIVLTFLTLLWSRAKLAAGTKLDPGE